MPDCPFCIIATQLQEGTTRVEAVYWGGFVVQFKPLNPVVPGHQIFVPKIHVADASIDPDVTAGVFKAAAEYSKKRGTPANLITSLGAEATQTVFHLHVHYVPRRKDDGLQLPWGGPEERRTSGHRK